MQKLLKRVLEQIFYFISFPSFLTSSTPSFRWWLPAAEHKFVDFGVAAGTGLFAEASGHIEFAVFGELAFASVGLPVAESVGVEAAGSLGLVAG